MFKRIITVLLIIALLSGCESKTAQTGETPPVPASSSVSAVESGKGKEDIFTYDDLSAFLMSKPLKCKYKTGKQTPSNTLEVTEISDLTYSVSDRSTGSIVKAVVTGSFIATGGLDVTRAYNKITCEPVLFEVTVRDGANGLSFTEFKAANTPVVKPIEPPDLDNLLQYINIEKQGPTIPYFDERVDPDNPLGRLDLNEPSLRIVIIEDDYPELFTLEYYYTEEDMDDENLSRLFAVEYYYGEEYICTGLIGFDYYGNPRAGISDALIKAR